MSAGILLLDKPPGPTSHDAVARARRALGVRRIGHFGTLDPFASGLLVLGVGPATRLAPFAGVHGKTYRAVVRLGARSTTDDREGEIAPVPVAAPPSAALVAAECARWIGDVDQVPPAFSAKHVAGERAYARARAGEIVALPPVRVAIERIDVLSYAWPDLEMEVACGPGTYVRALARDLGEGLGTGGYCEALRRTRSGPFSVEAAAGWDEIAEAALRPSQEAVADLPPARLDAAGARAAGQGRAVRLDASVSDAVRGARRVRIVGPAGFVGIGESETGPDGAVWVRPRAVLFPAGEDAR